MDELVPVCQSDTGAPDAEGVSPPPVNQSYCPIDSFIAFPKPQKCQINTWIIISGWLLSQNNAVKFQASASVNNLKRRHTSWSVNYSQNHPTGAAASRINQRRRQDSQSTPTESAPIPQLRTHGCLSDNKRWVVRRVSTPSSLSRETAGIGLHKASGTAITNQQHEKK